MALVYATWDSANTSPGATLSGGDLVFTSGGAVWYTARSTISKSSGKWYWEYTCTSGPNYLLGIGTASAPTSNGSIVGVSGGAVSWGYNGGGSKFHNGGATAYGAGFNAGDVIGVALDKDADTITFYKNGVSQGIAFNSGLTADMFAMASVNNAVLTANFGATAFSYTPPAGFNAGLYSGSVSAPAENALAFGGGM